MLDILSQTVIFLTGVTSIFLVARKNKWGFVVGLAGQLFWYITTWVHGQWFIFILSFAYTASWAYGVYEWFFKRTPLPKKAEE